MSSSKKVIRGAIERHRDILEKVFTETMSQVERGADLLLKVVKGGKKLLICGNGGSAADAQHLAGEWVCRYKNDRQPLSALALTVDTSVITAIGNDYGFDHVFARQVEALGNEGDALVAISTSGASLDVMRAIEAARKKKMKIIVLTGARGIHLNNLADVVLAVPSEETARIQEIHELVYHSWCEYIDSQLNV